MDIWKCLNSLSYLLQFSTILMPQAVLHPFSQKGSREKEGVQECALSAGLAWGTARVGAAALAFQECTWWLSQ